MVMLVTRASAGDARPRSSPLALKSNRSRSRFARPKVFDLRFKVFSRRRIFRKGGDLALAATPRLRTIFFENWYPFSSQRIQPFAVIACASGRAHKELASLVSSGGGAKGGVSTFPWAACETIAFASETKRKPFATVLFSAALTTQT